MKTNKIIISRPILDDRMGLPKFSGVKRVRVERRNNEPGRTAQWLCIRFTDGEATLPRGYQCLLTEHGEVEMKDL
jgi:hypothetical protein